MSSYLVDTSILARIIVPHDPLMPVARAALGALRQQHAEMWLASQNVVELWAVATRPPEANGLGLSTETTSAEIDRILNLLPIRGDPASTSTAGVCSCGRTM